MKTSNKILIIFGLSLILIPLIGMIYDSQTNHTDDKGFAAEETKRANEDANFNTPSKNMESQSIGTPFTSINVEDAKNMGLYIHYIEAAQYGVKVSKSLKDSIAFKVDADGQLQINLKNGSAGNDRNYISILVYAPSVKQLNVKNANALFVNAKVDSLSLYVNKSANISFDKEAVIKHLNVNAEQVENVNAWESQIANLTVQLTNSNLTSTRSSYEQLTISTTGKAEIEIVGGSEGEKKNTIKQLTLQTKDVAEVKLINMIVSNCSGSLSDETQVQMPALNLNQLYKVKK